MILKDRRKGYFKNKYINEWYIVIAFLLAVFVVAVMTNV